MFALSRLRERASPIVQHTRIGRGRKKDTLSQRSVLNL